MKTINTIETADLIQPYLNGIKFIHPENPNPSKILCDVDEFLHLPFNIFVMNTDSQMVLMNEELVAFAEFDSLKSALGTSVFDLAAKEVADRVRGNDLEVMRLAKLRFYEEDAITKTGDLFQSLTIKMPCYNVDNKINGVAGCSIILGKHSVSKSIVHLEQLGFIEKKSGPYSDLYFSQRELQCLRWTARGKTAKQIARILNLSHRTIEVYLENIKTKLNVKTKNELIDKVFDDFYFPINDKSTS